MTKATWYFDFVSPFAYLQLARFPALPPDLEITPVPVVFGALLEHWGQLGPAEIAPKRRFTYRFFQWHADKLSVPFAMPPRHPYNPLTALRLCIAAGGGIDHVRAVYDVIFGQGIQPDTPEGIEAIAALLGIPDPGAAMADPKIKATLRANTEQAISQGVFGVPAFVIDGQLFWGGDATEMMLDYVENPALFKTPEMKRISDMPMGVERKR